MKLAFLRTGDTQHGLYRYASKLSEAATELGHEVRNFDLSPELLSTPNTTAIANQLTKETFGCCFLQFNYQVWGGSKMGLKLANVLFEETSCPFVTTIHDMQYTPGFNSKPSLSPMAILKAAKNYFRNRKESSLKRRLFETMINRSKIVTVFNRRELDFASACSKRNHIRLLPHFVEQASETVLSADDAKTKLGYSPKSKLIIVLGFIHRRKSQHLLLKAAPFLKTKDYKIVLVGKCNSPEYHEELVKLATEKGLTSQQFKITGFLDEHELALYLNAADLAVCPFREMAASGSISTLIAADVPILGSDIPGIQDYNKISPGAIAISSLRPKELANQIEIMLNRDRPVISACLQHIREELNIHRTMNRLIKFVAGDVEIQAHGREAHGRNSIV